MSANDHEATEQGTVSRQDHIEVPWTYEGRVRVKPVGRGIDLEDHPWRHGGYLGLDEILPEGQHRWRITIEPLDEDG